ncbi:ATP-binding protein [Aliiglaciecola sp. CAU 1673]|uniref:ATP-binding protein n=1 Tax=Aliiglaciecola sp. CAU 1673 TaxID=3032595 RepID=UPI0023DB992F|nr:ATP-binding protein [Aliiglaciecola sp. CAU 1673]MDF2180283.1 ATP-binding protein [Aliiglaciecola sp. CAU 1673]
MKLPKLGLFARLFFLFGLTTILLGMCFAAAKAVFSEDKAKALVEERQDKLVKMLVRIEEKSANPEDVEKVADEIKGDILIAHGNERFSTDADFPDLSELLSRAEPVGKPIGELYFVKHSSGYYLLHQSDKGWVAITSNPLNYAIYPWWAVYWPWIAMLLVIACSYLILRRLMAPIFAAVNSVRAISTGDFSRKIARHPRNELAELTRGINQMSDELKAMFDAKNELLLAISHELRTPLARMKISLAMLESDEAAKEIERDLHQMDVLIGQLLEGERLEAGHKALHLKTLYLPSLIEEILAEPQLDGRIQLTASVPELALPLDAGRIKFLLRNLLLNSLKHNPEGTTVSLQVSEQGEQIELVVEDKGKGIPKEALPRLFEPFFCVENSSHRGTKGTGLGLYLCRKIALAHGGDLAVQSELGKGSRFILTLPH